MRHGTICIAALLAAAAAPAAAQPPQPPRDRTGPDALPPATPPFAQPGPPPLVQPSAPAPADTPLPPDAGGQLREVRVLEDAAGADRHAVPPRAWRPVSDPASGLAIDHRPGEPLGAAWVRRQFATNLAGGAGAGRAVALVQQINRAFLSAGFVNSGLLVQPGDDPGVLTMRLVHGRLVPPPGGGEAIEISFAGGGGRGLHPNYVRNRFPSAARRPLSAVAIERDFRLLTEDPALRTVSAQLRPGAGPGEASLALTILPRERADFYLSAGNSRSPAVGGERVGIGAYARHLFASGDLLSGEVGLTRGVVDVAAAYSAPIFSPATSLNLRGSYNEAAVIDTPLLPLDIRTRDVSGQASILHQFIREPLTPAGDGRWSPSRTLTAGIGISHRRQNSFLLGEPFSFAPGSVEGRAEYSALRLLGDYVTRNVDQVFALSVTGTMGLAGTRSDQPLVISPDQNFLTLLAQFNYARRLNAAGLELRARLTGQLASSVLYSGERLGVGGEQSVRGYRETLLLSDQGAVGSVELALPFTLSGEAGARRSFDWGAFSISAFVDGAYVDNVDGPEPSPDMIASTGLSLTWQPTEAMSLRVTYGHALVEVDPTGTTDIQDRGFHFRFSIYPLRMFGLY
jgi:hemolysin activation/secretion protein